VTGFEPFGGAAGNPSQDVVRALDGALLADGARLHGVVLPVSFARAPMLLLDALDALQPVLVLALGLARRRDAISLERVALNLCDASEPDNDGLQPVEAPVLPGGPPALFATLPLRAMLAALRNAGLPAALSLSAGSYVCNQLMYRLLHALQGRGVPAGFVHLPPTEVLDVGRQVEALRLMLDAARAEPHQSRST
jgi:pyroglutamyl-peptidase